MLFPARNSQPIYSGRHDWFAWIIAPLVFLSRCVTMSAPYFTDGPRLIQAVEAHVYVIQPPGYWLLARLAGLFHDPAFGLSFINALASSLGALVFYLLSLHLTTPLAARLATAAYASIYFAWFSGSIQSSYAAELLFPPLMFLFMLRSIERPAWSNVIGVAVSFALLSGFRPSDGVFMTPLFLYFLWRYCDRWTHRAILLCIAFALCLGWYIPQHIALQRTGQSAGGQLWSVAGAKAPILHGLSKLGISNILRVVVPMLFAFWSLAAVVVRSRHEPKRDMLWIWLLPGLAFFTAVYISDATYLCFLVAAIILFGLPRKPDKLAYAGLTVCFVWNLLFFSIARPVPQTRSLAVAIYSVSGARYCAWALRHQWFRTLDQFTTVPQIGAHARSAGNKNVSASRMR